MNSIIPVHMHTCFCVGPTDCGHGDCGNCDCRCDSGNDGCLVVLAIVAIILIVIGVLFVAIVMIWALTAILVRHADVLQKQSLTMIYPVKDLERASVEVVV
jgi:hypothetical protein